MNNMCGIIIKAISGFYYVFSNEIIFECKARGNFRKAEVSPVVGDSVEFSVISENKGVVEKILPRKNLLVRPIIANIDKLFIISSYKTPAPDLLIIDRLTAVCAYNNIEPIIVFNKCDMGDFSEFKRIYESSGFKTYVVSAENNVGLDGITDELVGCTSAFSGNSGVGKSSILNAVFPDLTLKTGEVSEKLGRGRHTTRHTELYPHKYGGFVADTPGFSSFEVDNSDYDFKIHLAECFLEFNEYVDFCRFTGCSHTCEKGCAVLDAVAKGNIEKSRHNSYKTIYDELKDLKQWNCLKK